MGNVTHIYEKKKNLLETRRFFFSPWKVYDSRNLKIFKKVPNAEKYNQIRPSDLLQKKN